MHRSLRFSLLAAATVALITSACTVERELDSLYEDLPEGMQSSDGLRQLRGDAFLVGDIGSVRDIQNTAEVTSYGEEYDGYKYDYVQLDVYDDSRGTWAMMGLTIDGGLDSPALRPNTTHTFTALSTYGNESQDLNVSAVGCSDPNNNGGFSDGSYYDEPADTVILDVQPGESPGTKQIDVTTIFSDGQEAQGSFTVGG